PVVNRKVPIIADERVEPEFGTGALKVTPGHDPKDFEIGRAHRLPELMAIRDDGLMDSSVTGFFDGWTQEAAAAAILEQADVEKREPYRHTIAVCERCGSRIEPLIRLQWWCEMAELRQPALAALRNRGV